MRRKIIYIMLMVILILSGCTMTQSGNSGNEKVSPTPVKKIELPKVDSSDEQLHIYTKEEKEAIIQMMNNNMGKKILGSSSFILAYYEYYNMQDIELPVVLGMKDEKAEELYGGEWVTVKPDEYLAPSVTSEEGWSYGIMDVKQIREVIDAENSYWVLVAADSTISKSTVGNIKIEDVAEGFNSVERLAIYSARNSGEVCIKLKKGEYVFEQSIIPDWEFY